MPANPLTDQCTADKQERIYMLTRHPQRHLVESFIGKRYMDDYGAKLSHFCTQLVISVFGTQLQAAIGYERADQQPLFLEQYFSLPVEQLIAQASNTPCTRSQIVEVGNLASDSPGALRRFILILGRYFVQQQYQWVVFTAIPSLLNTFEKFNVPLFELGIADPQALGDKAEHWGNYYSKSPKVMAAHISTGMAILQRNEMLSKLIEVQPRPQALSMNYEDRLCLK